MTKISVILTTYNVEKYINQCMDSLINQTFKDFELIVIDDGSVDNTVAIIKENYKDVKLIENEHLGVAYARNLGIQMAKGEYLCILDSDDYFELNMLEVMYNQAKIENADVVISGAYKFDDQTGEEVNLKYMLNEQIINGRSKLSPIKIKENLFQLTVANAWGKMFKRELIVRNNIKFQDLNNSNDVLFVFSSLVKADIIVPINQPLVHYRFNNQNSIQGKKSKNPYDFIKAYEALQEYLIKENIYNLYKQSFIEMIIHICLWNLKSFDNDNQKLIINLLKERYITYFKIFDCDRKNEKYYNLLNMIGERHEIH